MTIRSRSRRSFLAAVLGGTLLINGAAAGAAEDDRKMCGRRRRTGRRRTGVTDQDSGANADPAMYGRGATARWREPRRKLMQAGRPTGVTDTNSGANADPVDDSRRPHRSAVTDHDQGAYADAPCS